ncbi:cupin domain-containing protein [Paenibacillus hexagrammi]|uniref:Cupin domain-containing protein n=1 Tax=Paenibacillus hexagrammi TaxID=2908839 RepID=A0ABY3SSW6_9BACL|nr:cupin domain-containing protein [Paenibacillus sp. YPD9-1]UJF36072.1 cupin domain-containing protein [Paenibacillus sp. YPD9-1]
MNDHVLEHPDLELAADSNQTLNYKCDPNNFLTQLFGEQMPAIKTGFFNIYLSKGKIVEPHWHTNVTEMIVVISGEVTASVFNPFTHRLMTYRLKPGQVAVFPKGWFHWFVAEADHTYTMAIFDQPTPDIVYGADFLRSLPKDIVELAYCVDGEEFAKAVAPIRESVILGPPIGCRESMPVMRMTGDVSTSYMPPEYSRYCVESSYTTSNEQLKMETLQHVEICVTQGLDEARQYSAEHTLRKTSARSYLIGKGYHPSTAAQLVESWQL